MTKFGVGQSVLRREDDRLLRGEGNFVDDAPVAGLAFGYVVRSPFGHARILDIDISEAQESDGVLAIYTAKELRAAGLGAIPNDARPPTKPGTKFEERQQYPLAEEKVRYVGDPIAFVVGETYDQARDAGELVYVNFEDLPANCDTKAAINGPSVHDDVVGNIAFDWQSGDQTATEEAFSKATKTVELEVVNNRVVLNAIETRGAVGPYDADDDKMTLTCGNQMPNPVRNALAKHVFKIENEKLRVITDDVGGSFGGKNQPYPEYALVLQAARDLNCPVKWISQRAEAFVSDYHGRDNVTRGQLAFDDNHRIVGLRVHTYASLGAYVASGGPVSPTGGIVMISNTYRIPAIYVNVQAVYTNTVPTAPYRGAGRPEAIYLIERLLDRSAQELGVDRVELRRQNAIPLNDFPYASPAGMTYDDADILGMIDQATQLANWSSFADRRQHAKSSGRLRGIGMSNYIERCGGGAGLSEGAQMIFNEDGSVDVLSGSMSNGQGHETAFSQIVHQKLGLPFNKIRIIEGDTDRINSGTGTGGSWSIPMGGGAVAMAADDVIAKGKKIAADKLEAAESDLEFSDGQYIVAGTDIAISLPDVIAVMHSDPNLSLNAEVRFTPKHYTFPYGCHICEVEIDADTGEVEVLSYVAAHDFGLALNPSLLAGQVHGGVAQGVGQAVFEHTAYDETGQLLSGSLMDYNLPRASDMPNFVFSNIALTETSVNQFGIKGCGEAGATGSPPAVINAIVDALRDFKINHVDMPATPEKIWRLMNNA
jgi:carbon-monoxide dehydrogenase large subunit